MKPTDTKLIKQTERAENFCVLLDEAEKEQMSSRHKYSLQGGPAI